MDEELEWQVHRVCAFIGVVHGAVNVILCTCVLLLQLNDVKKYHLNFVILRFNFLLACYIICVTRVVNSVLTLVLPSIQAKEADGTVAVTRAVESTAMNMFRLGFTAHCLERFAATVFSGTYENRLVFKVVGPLLMLLADSVSAGISIGYTILGMSFSITVTVVMGFDLLSLLSVVSLEHCNRKLRRLYLTSDIRLTKRYQLVENLRVLRFLRPLICTGIFFSILALTCGLSLRFFTGSTTITRPVFYTIINVYVTVACFLTFWHYFMNPSKSKDASVRHGCHAQIVLRLTGGRVSTSTPPESDARPPTIRNALGEEIGQTATFDNHFNTLAKQWL
ncbi:hypothetical protein AAVH_39859 [Aphelenchoides avenae]|nr:hypothetical protein AAVH_39859 [Aphelenchus avenae]